MKGHSFLTAKNNYKMLHTSQELFFTVMIFTSIHSKREIYILHLNNKNRNHFRFKKLSLLLHRVCHTERFDCSLGNNGMQNYSSMHLGEFAYLIKGF